MSIFPVITSTLSPKHLAAFVKDKYGLQRTVTAYILKTGISHTYLIRDAADKYIFRVYSLGWRTVKEIQEEIRLLNLLSNKNIPVSYALPDIQSQYIQELQAPEGIRLAVMFSFAAGEKQLNFSPELHYKAGEIMATLHAVTHNLQLERVTYTPTVLLGDSYGLLKEFLEEDTAEMVFIKSLEQYLYTAFSEMNTAAARKGIVHLDIWFDNISIHNNTDITIFDFDFCGNGWLFLDIAYYILQIYSTETDEKEYQLKRDSFMKGYESVSPLTETEKNLVPAGGAAVYLFYLGVQCSRYDNWTNMFLNDVYLKRFINLRVKRWFDFNKLQFSAG